MKKFFLLSPFLCFFLIIVTNQSCYYDNETDLYPTGGTTTCDTTNAKFAVFVSPLITSQCATSGCHSATSTAAGINLGNYTAIKNYITGSKTAFLGSIKQTSGFSKMPKGGSKIADCDITKIERWITNGMLNN